MPDQGSLRFTKGMPAIPLRHRRSLTQQSKARAQRLEPASDFVMTLKIGDVAESAQHFATPCARPFRRVRTQR